MSQSTNTPPSKPSDSSSTPIQCVGGCGFWGNKEQRNCCSLCYKKMFPEEANANENNNKSTVNTNTNNNNNNNKDKDNECKEEAVLKQENAEKQKPKKKVQKKKNRCWMCRKKITLAGQFECKCGYVYCALHRYPDAHECDFDWKKQHQAKLAKDNKTVAPSKLDKI